MKLFGRRSAPRVKYIKNAPSGSIVYARHDIPGLLSTVPAASRGVLLTWIHRDPKASVVVKWDGIGNRDARASDLSPHFEPGPPLTVPRRGAASAGPQRPRPGERVQTVIVTEEPYDPAAPSPRPGEHERVEIITEEPM